MSTDTLAASDELYIPPPGIAFRILGYVSQQVIYSRTSEEPYVGQVSYDRLYSDQWFTLLHGSGDRKGLYAIKSQKTGKVLFSRRDGQPQIGHVDGNGYYNDNWFQLEPGKNQYSKCFRLITPSEKMALYSRTSEEPKLWNLPTEREIYSDQYFSFVYEDMQIDGVDYDLNNGRILSSTPLVISDQTLTNNTNAEQEMSFQVEKSVTNTSTFEYTTGFSIEIGTTFKAGVPFVSEAEFSVSIATNNEWTWGESTSYTTTYTATLPVKAVPGESVHAVSTVNQGILDVPYTIHLSSKKTGAKAETKGTWRGVSTWDLRHTLETVETDEE